MRLTKKIVATAVTFLAIGQQPLQAAMLGLPRGLTFQLERIQFETPALAPMAHTRFCLRYADDCKVRRMTFRKPAVSIDAKRWADLVEVNATVNRAIRPMRNNAGLWGEKWLVNPKAGDCNDYAVTKRHELLKRGWSSSALLLAEVVTRWGEHHLVLVVRSREGDFVLDNLDANVHGWTKAPYRWVRIQSPRNPHYWSTVATRTA
jgi:predicted transglutaminase-like cysteine proteinase